MNKELIQQFIKFTLPYLHTVGERERLRKAAKDFLNPP
jgi:hypothetical protein